jgi:Lrp/AsnC family transcriptional regulator, leucine-responsive regulatory protein
LKKPTPLSTLLDVTADYPADPVQLDELDRRLLALLSADARISRRQLAKALHMSPPGISERIARLERSGVIQGYAVKISWAALGYVTVYLSVAVLPGADQGAIIESLNALPEVEDVVLIAGSLDMLARMRVRNHSHLRELLLSRVFQIDGLQKTETLICVAEAPIKKRYVADLVEPDAPRFRTVTASVKDPLEPGSPA